MELSQTIAEHLFDLHAACCQAEELANDDNDPADWWKSAGSDD